MSVHDQSTPDWVMLGVPTPNGQVAVYASKELNHAELTHETEMDEYLWLWSDLIQRVPRRRIELTVEMRTYVVVIADTYAEAFRILFDEWSPEPARSELEPAVKAIES
jgi:hypothetical protein